MKFSDKLLHFIWRYKLIDQSKLITSEGTTLRILNFGKYNENAGPDFEFAKIELSQQTWIGNIEIHWSSSEWYQHKHQLDARYNTTILHVVWQHTDTQPTYRKDGTIIPTLELQCFVDPALLIKYQYLMEQEAWLTCEKQLPFIDPFQKINWLERIIVERLEQKIKLVQDWLQQTNYDWEKVQLIAIGRAFGMKVNAEAFEKLLFLMPLSILHKYADDPLKLESVLFGIGGFLELSTEKVDDYYADLRKEFLYLKQLHQLPVLDLHEWKYMRMRPYNFPTHRLAQFVGLIAKRLQWFEFVKQASLDEVVSDLGNIVASSYWSTHFHFQQPAKLHSTKLTKEFIQHILLNAYVPLLFTYGDYIDQAAMKNKGLEWLKQLPTEKNNILQRYADRGYEATSASESQALLHLYKNYCSSKKCLDCAIGYRILSG